MATAAKISTVITANQKDFEKNMAKATATAKKFQNSAVAINRKLKKIGAQATKVGKQMSVGLTAPIALLGGMAVKTFAEFEQSMAKVKAVSGATGEEFAMLSTLAEDLGESTRFTASEVATLQLNYSKLGFIPKEIEKITGATLNLALATGEDLAISAETAGATLRGFGLLATDMPKVVDVMAKSFSTSALDLEAFRESMKLVAPTAKATGRDIEDVTSMLGILANNGIKGSIAGTQLNRVFIELNKQGLSLEDAMDKVSGSSDGLGEATKLVGDRGAKALLIMSGQRKELVKYEEELRKADGSAEAMAKTMDDTLEGSMLKMKSAIEGMAISFGKELKPVIERVTKIAGQLANKFSGLSPKTKKMIVVIGGLVAAAGPLLVIFGAIATAIAAISGPMILVGVAVGALALGIASVVASGDDLTDQFEKQKEKVDHLEKSMTPLLERHDDLLSKSELTKDEQIELDQIIQDIAEHMPTAITGFDKYGKALSVNTDIAKAYIKEQKDILQFDNADAIREQESALAALGQKRKWFTSVLETYQKRLKEGLEVDGKALKAHQDIGEEIKKEIGIRVNKLLILKGELTATEKLLKAEQELAKANADAGGDDKDTPITPPVPPGVLQSYKELDHMIGTKLPESMALNNTSQHKAQEILRADIELNKVAAQAKADALAKLQAQAKAAGDAAASAFEAFGNRAIMAFGEAETGLGRFVQAMGSTALSLIAQLLSAAIAQSILGATISGTATGPAAVVSTPAFIATAVGGVLAAFASIPAFESGGLVTGPTVGLIGEGRGTNSSNPEVIAPLDKLQGMLGGQGGGGGTLTARVSGKDLLFVLRNQGISNKLTAPGNNFSS